MQSLRVFQSLLWVPIASAFSAHSAVKLKGIVISRENSTVSMRINLPLSLYPLVKDYIHAPASRMGFKNPLLDIE